MSHTTGRIGLDFAVGIGLLAAVFTLSGCAVHHNHPIPAGRTTLVRVVAPPASPAHGYVHHYREHDVVLVFDRAWGGYQVRSPGLYYYRGGYYRLQGSRWYRADRPRGSFAPVRSAGLPFALERHPARIARVEAKPARREPAAASRPGGSHPYRAATRQTQRARLDTKRAAARARRDTHLEEARRQEARRNEESQRSEARRRTQEEERRARDAQRRTQPQARPEPQDAKRDPRKPGAAGKQRAEQPMPGARRERAKPRRDHEPPAKGQRRDEEKQAKRFGKPPREPAPAANRADG